MATDDMTHWMLPLERGWYSAYRHAENETERVSTKSDPTKDRFAVDEDRVEHNLGGPSFNTRRVGGGSENNGRHDEHALIQGQLHGVVAGEGVRSGFGAIELCTRGPGQEAVEQRLLISHDRIISQLPIVAPLFASSGGESGGDVQLPVPSELHAADGVWWVAMQGDGDEGKLVMYKNRVAGDYSTGDGRVVASWSQLA